MTFAHTTSPPWSLPGCPAPPDWSLDWGTLLAQYPWLNDLADTPQDPHYHAEGDVLIHTRMVADALVALPAWQALAPPTRAVLLTAALLHDVAKPICTEIDGQGRISSPRHARKGEQLARTLLWRDASQYGGIPFPYREQVAQLIRHHGLPLWFLDKADPARAVVAASLVVRLDHVALLAEADVRGRICADQHELLDRIDLFRQYCAELGCLTQPRAFASAHSRFMYARNPDATLHYDAYDDTQFEVIMLCGLPAAGKDTWVRQHAGHLPVIALDAIRAELDIAPTEHPGRVVLAAKRRARELLQRQQPFVWNATNITRLLRRQLIDFFTDYRARVRIVYVDAPLDVILRRNRARLDPVPEKVIARMLEKFELPSPTEAHHVDYVWSS
jgi:predicted kinase